MPARDAEHHLHAVLSFYNSVVSVTAEGDSIVSEDLLEGLGTDGSSRSLVYTLFGSLLRVAFPFSHSKSTPEPPSIRTRDSIDRLPRPADDMGAAGMTASSAAKTLPARTQQTAAKTMALAELGVDDGTTEDDLTTTGATKAKKKYKLTDFVPDTGYFLAGAIAGGVSRTATAPLDRLKVYLLVNTNSGSDAVAAIKQGRPTASIKGAARPIGDAARYLFQTGGIRGFFAGECFRGAVAAC